MRKANGGGILTISFCVIVGLDDHAGCAAPSSSSSDNNCCSFHRTSNEYCGIFFVHRGSRGCNKYRNFFFGDGRSFNSDGITWSGSREDGVPNKRRSITVSPQRCLVLSCHREIDYGTLSFYSQRHRCLRKRIKWCSASDYELFTLGESRNGRESQSRGNIIDVGL